MAISIVAVLASPQPVNAQKDPRNVVFDTNLYITGDFEQSSLALLCCFVPDDMINNIQKITQNFLKGLHSH